MCTLVPLSITTHNIRLQKEQAGYSQETVYWKSVSAFSFITMTTTDDLARSLTRPVPIHAVPIHAVLIHVPSFPRCISMMGFRMLLLFS